MSWVSCSREPLSPSHVPSLEKNSTEADNILKQFEPSSKPKPGCIKIHCVMDSMTSRVFGIQQMRNLSIGAFFILAGAILWASLGSAPFSNRS